MLPKIFSDFSPYIPVSALQLIQLKELIPEAFRIARQAAFAPPCDLFTPAWTGPPATLLRQTVELPPTEWSTLPPPDKRAVGERILELYFAQIFHSEAWSLDLRLVHFASTTATPLLWRPSPLWKKFSPEFRRNVQCLYRGFYEQDSRQFHQGLDVFGLPPRSSQGPAVTQALHNHFGDALSQNMKFSLDSFTQSFDSLFRVLKKSQARVHSDFAFFGIYLASLYIALENLGQSYDVRGAYLCAEKNRRTLSPPNSSSSRIQ